MWGLFDYGCVSARSLVRNYFVPVVNNLKGLYRREWVPLLRQDRTIVASRLIDIVLVLAKMP